MKNKANWKKILNSKFEKRCRLFTQSKNFEILISLQGRSIFDTLRFFSTPSFFTFSKIEGLEGSRLNIWELKHDSESNEKYSVNINKIEIPRGRYTFSSVDARKLSILYLTSFIHSSSRGSSLGSLTSLGRSPNIFRHSIFSFSLSALSQAKSEREMCRLGNTFKKDSYLISSSSPNSRAPILSSLGESLWALKR